MSCGSSVKNDVDDEEVYEVDGRRRNLCRSANTIRLASSFNNRHSRHNEAENQPRLGDSIIIIIIIIIVASFEISAYEITMPFISMRSIDLP